MRESLGRYLRIFSKIYPTRPALEVFSVYERVLDDASDMEIEAACEQCLSQCSYFPLPAEIKARLPVRDNFCVTSSPREDIEPIDAKTLAEIGSQFEALRAKISQSTRIQNPSKKEEPREFGWNGISFTATVKPGQSLIEWAKMQDLNEDLPRTPQEIEFIRTVQEFEKPKRKRKRGRNGQKKI
jgi:hypothetical protein